MRACESLNLLQRHVVHHALWLGRPMPKSDRQHPTRLQQCDKLAERARPVDGRNMLPDDAEQNEVRRKAKAKGYDKRREAVFHPAYAVIGAQRSTLLVHGRGGLDRHHVVSLASHPCSVTPGASTDVKHQGAIDRQEGSEPCVRLINGH
jgi:hypothetical protein